jgi:hypothetical protein
MNIIAYTQAWYKIKRYEILHSFRKSRAEFDEQVEAAAAAIRSQGYVVFEDYFSVEQCAEVRQEIDRLLVAYPDVVQRDSKDSDHRFFGANNASPLIAELFWQDVFLNGVRDCFYEHSDIVGCTLAARMDAKAGNAGSGGGWHRDMIFGRQLKSIAYFSDVTPESGPFQFLSNTHQDSSILETVQKCGIGAFQNRLSEEEVAKIQAIAHYENLTFTGKAGTLIIVETTSIHRGMPIKSGSRYALTNYWFEQQIPEHIERLIFKHK